MYTLGKLRAQYCRAKIVLVSSYMQVLNNFPMRKKQARVRSVDNKFYSQTATLNITHINFSQQPQPSHFLPPSLGPPSPYHQTSAYQLDQ